MTDLPIHRRRVPEMLAQGYELVHLPADPEAPAIMRGPDTDDFGTWAQLSALIREAADA